MRVVGMSIRQNERTKGIQLDEANFSVRDAGLSKPPAIITKIRWRIMADTAIPASSRA